MSSATVFDLFGTLVTVADQPSPASAVARELADRGVAVPDEWETVYRESHLDVPAGREISLSDHVTAALAHCGIDAPEAASDAVRSAFDPTVSTRTDATAAIAAATTAGPVGLLSNCAVVGLVGRTLQAAAIDPDSFDAVVTSVDCGWRKPHRCAFESVATALDTDVAQLRVVGDTPATDGGITEYGGEFINVQDCSLADCCDRLTGDKP